MFDNDSGRKLPAARWRRRVGRIAAGVLIFLMPVLLLILAGTAPMPPYFNFQLERFHRESEQAPFDFVVFGSSYVGCHLVPTVIEESSGLRGFNFGIGGLHGYDLECAIVEAVRSMDPLPPVVVLDLAQWPTVSERPEAARRLARFRTGPSFRMAAWSARNGDLAGAFLQLFELSKRQLRLGALIPEPPPITDPLESERVSRDLLNYGYSRLEPKSWTPAAEARLLKTMRRNLENDHENPRIDLRNLKRLAGWLRRRGVTPVFVRAPLSTRFRGERRSDYDALAHVLWFDDPGAYPRLFEPTLRYDERHLNTNGARLYSRLFAVRLAGIVEAVPG